MTKHGDLSTKVKVRSMTSVSSVNTFVDLEKIASRDKSFEYEPEIYPGAILRLKNPRVGFLIFSNGKIVCTGGKTIQEVKSGLGKMCAKLRSAGICFDEVSEPRICNVVATADLGHPVDIESLALQLRGSLYEPEQFPALVYRLEPRNVVALVFNSGKTVLTGGKTMANLECAYHRLQEVISHAETRSTSTPAPEEP